MTQTEAARRKFDTEIEAVSRTPVVGTVLDVVRQTTGMGFAAVARITEGRWIACNVRDGINFGLRPGDELRLEATICLDVRKSGAAIVIDDVAEDIAYNGREIAAQYGFRSYISMPITLPDGSFFGTLCAIDPKPRQVNRPEIIDSFRLFAELIAFHLDTSQKLARSEASLSEAREVADLREQFIAVLGHDLRNPLAAIAAGTSSLVRHPERAGEIAGHMERSIGRMSELIDNVLDLARGRLGGGLAMSSDATDQLVPTLQQVVQELQNTHRDRIIQTTFTLDDPVICDHQRIGQLLSNLLANALTHGAPDTLVRVCGVSRDGRFELRVSNGGDAIPPEVMRSLFQPFFRGKIRNNQQGLGLGLYIASEIARAHHGTLEVTSAARETCFILRMPARPASPQHPLQGDRRSVQAQDRDS